MDKEFVSLISVGVAVLLGAMSPGASFLLATRTALSSAPRASLAVSLGLATGAMLFLSPPCSGCRRFLCWFLGYIQY